ncbi:MAG: c-type cytochrome [Pseudorhodobacter sp.]|nr:c-type cytochrome [Pseudorhodobacter sp.]
MSKFRDLVIGSALLTAIATAFAAPAFADKLGIGRSALPEEVAAWNLDVSPDGTGLPEGSGDVLTGEELFSENCASCHGEFGEGQGNWPKLAGGKGTLADADPLKTVGSYWPHLSTTFDYVNRSMPFGNAQSLSPDEVYAITAYILYNNDLVDEDFVLSNENFTDVVLPNAGGFILDDRDTTEVPKFTREPCMEACKESVEITAHATVLDVTPEVADTTGAPPVEAAAEQAVEPAAESAGEPAAANPVVAPAAEPAAADPELIAAGKTVFKKCLACHRAGEGAKNSTGPVLNGIVGRAAGTIEGFKYSKPLMDMAAAGLVWDEATIQAFIENPKGFMKGTKMTFAGLKKPEDRAAVIAYLATFVP